MHKNSVCNFIKTHKKHLIFCLYLGTIINIYIYLKIAPNELNAAYKIFLILSSLIVYIISYFLSILAAKLVHKTKLTPPPKKQATKKKRLIIFSITFIICFLIGLIWLVAFFPGGFSADSVSQYIQASTGNYSDWHPTIHTLIMFNLPLNIFGTPESIIIFQIIIFSLAIAYSTTTIYNIAGKKWSIAFLLITISNPIVFDELMFAWKDTTFAITALFITTITLKIYCNNGNWNKKISHLITLGIVLSLCTLFRHNGLLFTIPVVIFIYPFIPKKQYLIMLTTFLITIFLIKIPLYSTLQVEAPGRRTVETTGLPITIMGNVAKYNSQSMDEETSRLIYEIAPAEIWENTYITGNFNSIKFDNANLNTIEEYNPTKIFFLAAKTAIKSPKASLTAFFKLTTVVYGIDDIPAAVIPAIHPNNKANISYNGNKTLASIIRSYRTIHNESILKYTGYCGFTILTILAFILFKNSRKNLKKILLCTPILFYDFGTMLLLSGPETRFFYINFLIYPVIIIIASIHSTQHKKIRKKTRTLSLP